MKEKDLEVANGNGYGTLTYISVDELNVRQIMRYTVFFLPIEVKEQCYILAH